MPWRPFVLLITHSDGPRGLTSSVLRQLLAVEALSGVSQRIDIDRDFLSSGGGGGVL